MIPDRDVWQAALAMVRRYGLGAMLKASQRADQLLEDGDWQGAVTWYRILYCIESVQASTLLDGEAVH